jgi:hypothetical protein
MEEEPQEPLWPEDAPSVSIGHAYFVEYTKPTRRKKKNPIGFDYRAQRVEKTSPSSSADERLPAKEEDGGSNPL